MQKHKVLCINDGFHIQNEEKVMHDFIVTMDNLLPEKSRFEL